MLSLISLQQKKVQSWLSSNLINVNWWVSLLSVSTQTTTKTPPHAHDCFLPFEDEEVPAAHSISGLGIHSVPAKRDRARARNIPTPEQPACLLPPRPSLSISQVWENRIGTFFTPVTLAIFRISFFFFTEVKRDDRQPFFGPSYVRLIPYLARDPVVTFKAIIVDYRTMIHSSQLLPQTTVENAA